MKKCPGCGKQIHNEASFCPYCMTKLKAGRNIQPKKESKVALFVIGAQLCIIMVLIFVIIYIAKDNNAIIPTETTKDKVVDATETTKDKVVDVTESTEDIKGDSEIVFEKLKQNSEVCCYLPPDVCMIWEYFYDEENNTLYFCTSKENTFEIDISKKNINLSSHDNVQLTECYMEDGIIYLKIYIYDFASEVSFVFDVSKENNYALPEIFRREVIDNYVVYEDGRIEFITESREYHYFDYVNSEYIDGGERVIVDSVIKEGVLLLTVKENVNSTIEKKYIINLSVNKVDKDTPLQGKEEIFRNDVITYAKVNKQQNQIAFDTLNGPQYTINYITGEIMYCSSIYCMKNGELAEVIDYKYEDEVCIFTLISGELLKEMTYAFNISDYQ